MKYEMSISEDRAYLKIKVYETISAEMEKEFVEKAIKTLSRAK